MLLKNGTHYLNPRFNQEGGDLIYLRAVGVDELVEGHTLAQNGGVGQFIFMFFHTEALLTLDGASPQEAGGCLVLLPRNVVCTYGRANRPWRHSWLVMGGSAIDGLVTESGLEPGRLYHQPDLGARFAFHCQEFYREATRPGPADQRMLTLMTELMLHDLARWVSRRHGGKPMPPALQQLEDYLEAHLDQRLTLEDLARRCFLSVPRFSTLCRQHFGQSPMALLNHKRMMRAAILLRTSRLAIGEIAGRCGFADQLYFSSRFHHYWKVSPRRFRQDASASP